MALRGVLPAVTKLSDSDVEAAHVDFQFVITFFHCPQDGGQKPQAKSKAKAKSKSKGGPVAEPKKTLPKKRPAASVAASVEVEVEVEEEEQIEQGNAGESAEVSESVDPERQNANGPAASAKSLFKRPSALRRPSAHLSFILHLVETRD